MTLVHLVLAVSFSGLDDWLRRIPRSTLLKYSSVDTDGLLNREGVASEASSSISITLR